MDLHLYCIPRLLHTAQCRLCEAHIKGKVAATGLYCGIFSYLVISYRFTLVEPAFHDCSRDAVSFLLHAASISGVTTAPGLVAGWLAASGSG